MPRQHEVDFNVHPPIHDEIFGSDPDGFYNDTPKGAIGENVNYIGSRAAIIFRCAISAIATRRSPAHAAAGGRHRLQPQKRAEPLPDPLVSMSGPTPGETSMSTQRDPHAVARFEGWRNSATRAACSGRSDG
jgi:hypothetical protein